MDWKTEQEWIVMRYFRENCQELPKGKLVKGESPDFQLWISPRRFIGIELTQVHSFNELSLQGHLDQTLAVRQVIECVRAKEEKIRLYRSDKPYQLWLIIFADYSDDGAMEQLVLEYRDKKLRSSFDEVYVFDLDTRRTLHLT
jgi:hypothetical protein